MIFLTVGTQLPFDRLVTSMDDWAAGQVGLSIIAQTGQSSYQPLHLECHGSLTPEAFQQLFFQAEVIVGHAGMGTIIKSLEYGKPLVMMPRREDLGEHRNDHQLATAARFSDRDSIRTIESSEQLSTAMDWALDYARDRTKISRCPAVSPALATAIQKFVFGPTSES
jgi:UDP-N-acetylglucosamine transferase subunit ALG13